MHFFSPSTITFSNSKVVTTPSRRSWMEGCNSRSASAARSTVLWFSHNPWQPVDGVLMEDLAQNGPRQRQTLVAVPIVLNALVCSEKFPIPRVRAVPLRERFFGIVRRQDGQVGGVEDSVLVFDQEWPHLIT